MVARRDPEDGRVARVRVSGAGAGALRRLAQADDDGVLTINYTDTAWLARIVASAGSSAHVLEPADLARCRRRPAAHGGRTRAPGGSALMASANEERLPRLLALVPYLQARPNIAVAEAAADFGVTEAQLRRDLTLLWMCGLPGHGPGDLIDLSFEGETVSVIFDAGMSRPLRLTAEEALALVVALRTLAETPGLADTDAVQRALAKVEAAAGGAVDDATVAVELDHDERLLPVLARAVDEQRALRLRYYSASRDETTERVVDPMRVFDADGRSYVEAGAAGPRACGCSGSTASTTSCCSTSRPRSRPTCSCATCPRVCSSRPPSTCWSSCGWARPTPGWPTTTRPRTPYPDGDNVRVELRVADPGWVRALVLGSAGQVEVLSPDWLAEDVRADAERALAAYAAR